MAVYPGPDTILDDFDLEIIYDVGDLSGIEWINQEDFQLEFVLGYHGFGIVCGAGGRSPVERGQAFPTKRGV